jgi:hypothetical protein
MLMVLSVERSRVLTRDIEVEVEVEVKVEVAALRISKYYAWLAQVWVTTQFAKQYRISLTLVWAKQGIKSQLENLGEDSRFHIGYKTLVLQWLMPRDA